MDSATLVLEERIAALHAILLELAPLAVAFSGGVDSSVLLHAAHAALGPRVRALIADSPSLPRRELAEARELAGRLGVDLVVVPTAELERAEYRANSGDRCYWCRRTLFEEMRAFAEREGFAHLAYGEILDDLADERPGRRAAGEFGVHAPLVRAGFTKEDVRAYARRFGLPVAEKPAQACLASRIPVGIEVTSARLARIEAAERAVEGVGFGVLRVRDRGRLARVEVDASDLARARCARAELAARLAPLGFEELEVEAYRAPGSR